MERQINEAVRITSSRSEFHQAPIIRQVVTHGLGGEQGEEGFYIRAGEGRGSGRRRESVQGGGGARGGGAQRGGGQGEEARGAQGSRMRGRGQRRAPGES